MLSDRKLLSELGDKVDGAEKAEIEEGIKSLRTAIEQDNTEAIESGVEHLTQLSHKLAEKLYQAGEAPGAAPGGAPGRIWTRPGAGADDDVIDADFEETN